MAFLTRSSGALPLAALCILACADASGVSEIPTVPSVVGEWTYARAPAPSAPATSPSLNAGLWVTIAVDSAVGERFWGHVARWFAGDYGIPLDRFGPVTGTIDSMNGVILRIAPAMVEGVTIQARLDVDFLIVDASWTTSAAGPFPQGCMFQRLH